MGANHEIRRGVAWSEDVERYRNPSDYGLRPNTEWLYDLYPGIVSYEEGVRNDQFVQWMRPSATFRVWNAYGYVDDEIQEGQHLTIQITSNFPTESIGAFKTLVLTEQ